MCEGEREGGEGEGEVSRHHVLLIVCPIVCPTACAPSLLQTSSDNLVIP